MDAYTRSDMDSLIIKEEIAELEYLEEDVAMTTSLWNVTHQRDGRIMVNNRYVSYICIII